MAGRKIAGKGGGMDADSKALTMMRPGELFSLDEEQRIALFEMVKDGSISIEDAHAEVKRTKPKQFQVKHVASIPILAPTLKTTLTEEQALRVAGEAAAKIKKLKPTPMKVKLHCSTVGIKFSEEAVAEDEIDTILENEPIGQISHALVQPGDKKRVMYITSYSRLGLVWAHVFQTSKSKEASQIAETILDRRATAAEQKSLVKASNVENMSAFVGDDEEEEGGAVGCFNVQYLGNVAVADISGDEVVRDAVHKMKDVIKEAAGGTGRRGSTSGRSKRSASARSDHSNGDNAHSEEGVMNIGVILVVSSEGVRIVDDVTRETIGNIVIKAISYSTEIVGKKVELFSFIEVDDRRNSKTCHIFMCERGVKGAALSICDAVCDAFDAAVQEAKARAGNPLLAMGKIRETVDGPLATRQVQRKDLIAVKAIGAGQFGKVYLATTSAEDIGGDSASNNRAVKMLRSGASSADRTEFLREAETMLDIGEHEYIVKFVGVAVRQRPWLVVLEYCQYGDLSDVLKALKRRKLTLTTKEQLKIANQLSSGMAYIASKRYVHMDLAARNVLVDTNSVMKIADFGLTHPYDKDKDGYKQVGVMKLSIRWLAIDSFDNKIFTEKADVWSWGITMWEVFSYGTQPYRGFKLQEVLKMVRAGYRLEPLMGCPEDVFALLKTCWEEARDKRPTFAALLTATQALMDKYATDAADRDIGRMLNAQLTAKIQRASMRVKSKPAGGGGDIPTSGPGSRGASPVDSEGLTGTVDTEGKLEKTAPLTVEEDKEN